MKWRLRDINVSDIELKSKPRAKYKELYDCIFALGVGKGFEIEAESVKEAEDTRNAVYAMLKRKGLSDKYITVCRLNKFYCGRTK